MTHYANIAFRLATTHRQSTNRDCASIFSRKHNVLTLTVHWSSIGTVGQTDWQTDRQTERNDTSRSVCRHAIKNNNGGMWTLTLQEIKSINRVLQLFKRDSQNDFCVLVDYWEYVSCYKAINAYGILNNTCRRQAEIRVAHDTGNDYYCKSVYCCDDTSRMKKIYVLANCCCALIWNIVLCNEVETKYSYFNTRTQAKKIYASVSQIKAPLIRILILGPKSKAQVTLLENGWVLFQVNLSFWCSKTELYFTQPAWTFHIANMYNHLFFCVTIIDDDFHDRFR